jgi:UrcA family protein
MNNSRQELSTDGRSRRENLKSTHALSTIGVSCALTIGFSGAFGAFAAYAGEPGATDQNARHVTVHYSDLNLTDPVGMKTLYGRLRGAASAVCGDIATHEIRQMSVYQECFDRALQNSVNSFDNPALHVLHTLRTPTAG